MKRQVRVAVLSAFLSTWIGGEVLAADHREAPLIRGDSAADIADVYAFLNPSDAGTLVLAMTVNPFSVPSEAVTFDFSPDVRYRFNIDNDGDAVADFVVQLRMSDGQVTATFGDDIVVTGNVTAPSEEPVPNEPIIIEGPDGIRVFVGPRDDPFFFDVVGFFRFLGGTGGFSGTDGFAGFNVSAIVVELPLSLIGPPDAVLQIWADTSRRLRTVRRTVAGELAIEVGLYQQIERMGNPVINTALIPSDLKDFYNIGVPADDAEDFAGAIVASLEALGTNEENIGILASVAVPDTLKLDPATAIGYPNGRAPADDVIDTLFFFIFNQTEVPDGVDANDAAFSDEFPYLAAPFQAP